MEHHLNRAIRFTTDIQYKNLYQWALQEVAVDGRVHDSDLIPWQWTLNFQASSLVLQQSVEAHGDGAEAKSNEFIQASLVPSERDRLAPHFSMLGTDRTIKEITLTVRRASNQEPRHSCRAWGVVSYTAETDFIDETTPDVLGFEETLPDDHFAALCEVALRAAGEASIGFSVSGVSGFYSDWSPRITTDRVKVLTSYGEQKVALPPEISDVPRLGSIGHFALTISRRTALARNAVDKIEESTIEDSPAPIAPAPFPRAEGINHTPPPADLVRLHQAVRSLRLPLWLLVVGLGALLMKG